MVKEIMATFILKNKTCFTFIGYLLAYCMQQSPS